MPPWTVAQLLAQWIEAGQPIDAFWRATPRMVLIAIHAYFERRAWAAWATGMTAAGAVKQYADLLPKAPETTEQREARVDRGINELNLRFAAMADAQADMEAGGEA